MEVSFEKLNELLEKGENVNDQQLRILSAPENPESLTITSNTILRFDPDVEFSCKSIKIINCDVEIIDLTMSGTIQMSNAKLKLTNCKIHKPADGSDYLIDVGSYSRATITNCSFGAHSQVS